MPTDLHVTGAPHGAEATAAGLAEWITEDLLQRLYAARQDLAEAAERDPRGAARAEESREALLEVIRRLRETATRLLDEPAGPPSTRAERLAADVARECREAARRHGVALPAVPRAFRGDGGA